MNTTTDLEKLVIRLARIDDDASPLSYRTFYERDARVIVLSVGNSKLAGRVAEDEASDEPVKRRLLNAMVLSLAVRRRPPESRLSDDDVKALFDAGFQKTRGLDVVYRERRTWWRTLLGFISPSRFPPEEHTVASYKYIDPRMKALALERDVKVAIREV
jgi:hypothetical protein